MNHYAYIYTGLSLHYKRLHFKEETIQIWVKISRAHDKNYITSYS